MNKRSDPAEIIANQGLDLDKEGKRNLAVFSEGIVTFCATQELC